MLVAVQTYVNYTTIFEKTLQVQEQTKRVKDEIIDMRRQLRKKRVKVYYYDYTK